MIGDVYTASGIPSRQMRCYVCFREHILGFNSGVWQEDEASERHLYDDTEREDVVIARTTKSIMQTQLFLLPMKSERSSAMDVPRNFWGDLCLRAYAPLACYFSFIIMATGSYISCSQLRLWLSQKESIILQFPHVSALSTLL